MVTTLTQGIEDIKADNAALAQTVANLQDALIRQANNVIALSVKSQQLRNLLAEAMDILPVADRKRLMRKLESQAHD